MRWHDFNEQFDAKMSDVLFLWSSLEANSFLFTQIHKNFFRVLKKISTPMFDFQLDIH